MLAYAEQSHLNPGSLILANSSHFSWRHDTLTWMVAGRGDLNDPSLAEPVEGQRGTSTTAVDSAMVQTEVHEPLSNKDVGHENQNGCTC